MSIAHSNFFATYSVSWKSSLKYTTNETDAVQRERSRSYPPRRNHACYQFPLLPHPRTRGHDPDPASGDGEQPPEELALHTTVEGFKTLLARKDDTIRTFDEKMQHLKQVSASLESKNDALLKENNDLRARLESSLVGGVSSFTASESFFALPIENTSFNAQGSYAELGSNAGQPATLPPPTDSHLSSTTRKLAQAQQLNKDYAHQMNLLVGILNSVLTQPSHPSASSASRAGNGDIGSAFASPAVKEDLAKVCDFLFQRDGCVPRFLFLHFSGKTEAGRGSTGAGIGNDARAAKQLFSSSGNGAGGSAAVSLLLRKNDELQKRIVDLTSTV